MPTHAEYYKCLFKKMKTMKKGKTVENFYFNISLKECYN